MIKQAYLYSAELSECFSNIAVDEHFKYYLLSYSTFEFNPDKDNWNRHEYAIVDKNNKVIGYIHYSIDRYSNNAGNLAIINFTKKTNLTFALDLKQVLSDIFLKFNFNRIEWSVIIGNPIEKSYDKICEMANGRIIGIFKKETRLFDGKYYDRKYYEVLRDDFLNSKAYKILQRGNDK